MQIHKRFLGAILLFAFPFLVSAATTNSSDTIPVSFNDPTFNGLTTSANRVTIQNGGALSNASIVESSGQPSITCYGACTVNNVRVNSREAFRVGGDGTVSISNSYLEANGTGDDHADGIQTYSPGSRGTIKVTNSSINLGTTAVNAAFFVADNWTGTIDLENVVIKGGLYGFRVHPDTGGDNTISLKDVYFVGPFMYGEILMTDVAGHKNTITKWENVRHATIVNGELVPGALIPCPLSSCGTSTSTPTPETPSASTKFSTNSRVQVVNGPLNVRVSATTAATLLGSQANGSLGTVVGGPVAQGGYVWWNINYDAGADGWSVENYLTKYAAPTTPTTPPTTPTTPTPTTPTVVDKKRPTKPTGLRATADSSSQISLSWNASSDDVGVTGYEVFRNGHHVGTPTGTTYSDTGLSDSTTYKYQVRAIDASGRHSYKSTTAKARTLEEGSTPTTPTTSEDEPTTSTTPTAPAPSSSGTVPLTFNDSMFGGVTNSDSVSLQNGGSLTNKSITVDGPAASVLCQGSCALDRVRVHSAEAIRVGGSGTVSISNSYLEATGSGDDHADVIQTYSPGDRGTINITNTSIVAHNTAATAGLFVADNWTGNINLNNVVFNGGPFGLRLHPDVGGDNVITAKDVYFVGPFGYEPMLLSDVGGHKNIIKRWENVRYATIVNGELVPGALIPCPVSNCGTTTSTPAPTDDTTAPAAPSGLSASASSASAISLSWNASTDAVGVTGYRIYRNGTQVGTATSRSYSDTGLSASTAYSYTVKAVDAAGNVSANSSTASATTKEGESAPSTTPAPSTSGTAYSIWNTSNTPANTSEQDTSAVELGMKFSSNTAGAVTGVRFYKGSKNTGTHTGSLWSASGTRLATGTFTSESASGWQTLMFSSPVSISANTTYVVSYHTNVGWYAGDKDYFATARTNGSLTAPKNAGVYKYGAGAFPNQTYESTNYWVDVLFVPSASAFNASSMLASVASALPQKSTPTDATNAVYSPFAAGDTVKTKANLNVRSTPNGAIIGVASLGSAGVVNSMPQPADGVTWVHITYQNGLSGWSSAGYLTR